MSNIRVNGGQEQQGIKSQDASRPTLFGRLLNQSRHGGPPEQKLEALGLAEIQVIPHLIATPADAEQTSELYKSQYYARDGVWGDRGERPGAP